MAAQLTNTILVSFTAQGAARWLAPQTEDNLFRIAQEAVTNALKHTRARRIDIQLEFQPGLVRLTVRDDGSGFHAGAGDKLPGGLGLLGMRERADKIGAALRIESQPGQGTIITAEVEA